MDRLYEATRGEATIVSGVGQHQMWASQHYKFTRPRQWINSGGLGTMGFAVPAAIGAKIGNPDQLVVAVDGDGCFQMTAQELATSTTEHIPIVVAIINNGYLGMVRQWQELFYGERYSQVHLSQDVPDYVKLAEAFGAVGLRAESADDVGPVLDKALSITDRSVVIDFRVDQGEMVFPMVPAGASNDDIILGPEFVKPVDDPGGGTGRMSLHTVSVLVEDQPGVLTQVSSLFARRGFNIHSLAVGTTERSGMSRMTIVVEVTAKPLEQVTKQLNKLVSVIKVTELEPDVVGRARAGADQGAHQGRRAVPGARAGGDLPRARHRRGPQHGDDRGQRAAGEGRRVPRAARAVRARRDGPHRPHRAGAGRGRHPGPPAGGRQGRIGRQATWEACSTTGTSTGRRWRTRRSRYSGTAARGTRTR